MLLSRSNPLWVVVGPLVLFLVFLGLMEPGPLTFNEWVGWFAVWILGGFMVYETCDGLWTKKLWMRITFSLIGVIIIFGVAALWLTRGGPTSVNQLIGYVYAFCHGSALIKVLYRPTGVWAKVFERLGVYWPPFPIVRKP